MEDGRLLILLNLGKEFIGVLHILLSTFACLKVSIIKSKKRGGGGAEKLPSWNSGPGYRTPETVIITIVVAFLKFHTTKNVNKK